LQEVAVTRVLVLVPTRELGVQVYQVTKQLAQFTSIEVALSVGGLDLRTQEAVMRRNPDIVIATPGRLIDHVKNTPTFSLESIEVLILDEAGKPKKIAMIERSSVSDPDPPDPHVFGPLGSGSFYHHAKIGRKTLIPTIL
jgi:hypothetical protein